MQPDVCNPNGSESRNNGAEMESMPSKTNHSLITELPVNKKIPQYVCHIYWFPQVNNNRLKQNLSRTKFRYVFRLKSNH